MKTNVARSFLCLIGKHFRNKLNKIFNRGTVKVSYSCVDSMTSIIKRHNNKVLNTAPEESPVKTCNCSKDTQCPIDSACLMDNLVYEAEIKAPGKQTKKYIEMTEHSFKSRFNNHKQSLKHKCYANSTALSAYAWELKKSEIN